MARPKRAVPNIEKTICLPNDLVIKVDLLLFSELESRVPHGAWSAFVTRALEDRLALMAEREAALGKEKP